MHRVRVGAVTLAVVLLAALALSQWTGASAGSVEPIKVGGMIFTTFPAEQAPFFDLAQWPKTIEVQGLANSPDNPKGEVRCRTVKAAGKKTWLCVTVTGGTKSNSGPSTMAILKDPHFRFSSKTLFAIVGIAGIESEDGTLGTVGVGDWVVDADLGTHFVDPKQAPPHGWLTFDEGLTPYTQAAMPLNRSLAGKALRIGRTVTLLDDDAARAERKFYGPAEAAEKPTVKHCDSVGSDSFWVGADWAAKADFIAQTRISAKDPNYKVRCTLSDFEDPGIVSALRRFGAGDRAIVFRSGSDFEDQRPGTSPRDLYDLLHSPEGFGGFTVAAVNGARVGNRVMEVLVKQQQAA